MAEGLVSYDASVPDLFRRGVLYLHLRIRFAVTPGCYGGRESAWCNLTDVTYPFMVIAKFLPERMEGIWLRGPIPITPVRSDRVSEGKA